MAPIIVSSDTGLKVPLVVRFDMIATLDQSIIMGKLGDARSLRLAVQQASFFSAFGFGQPRYPLLRPERPLRLNRCRRDLPSPLTFSPV
jgi:hypothetical protein